MMKARIRLAFRIVIDQNSQHVWDKYVFEDTFFEYKIQHQVFNSKENPVKNYWELLIQNPHSKNIPFLLSAACENYIRQLNGEIKSLPDVLGNTFFKFESYMLDVVSSNIEDSSKHKIGITFFSPEILLIDIVGNQYLLSEETEKKNSFQTFMMPFHPQVSIIFYEEIMN